MQELKPGSHIYCQPQALPVATCDDMIDRFEQAGSEQYPGRVGQDAQEKTDIKRSTDLVVSGKPQWKDVDQRLFRSLAAGINFMKTRSEFFHGRFKDNGYAIQRTQAGEYFHWHTDSGSHSFAERQLVAIWYLNDVEGPGGETEFRFQDVRVKPEKGKLILFPPFWTHEHRGVTLEAGVKYIATTWVMFA